MPWPSGKRAFLELLKQEGVEILFGNPGTTELPLMDALAVVPELRYVLGLQEAFDRILREYQGHSPIDDFPVQGAEESSPDLEEPGNSQPQAGPRIGRPELLESTAEPTAVPIHARV